MPQTNLTAGVRFIATADEPLIFRSQSALLIAQFITVADQKIVSDQFQILLNCLPLFPGCRGTDIVQIVIGVIAQLLELSRTA